MAVLPVGGETAELHDFTPRDIKLLRTAAVRQEAASSFRGYNWCMGNPFRNGSSSVLEPISRDPQTAALTHGSMEFSSDNDPSRDSSALKRILHGPVITALILGVASFLFFLAGIRRPTSTVLYEGLYVAEASAFFQGELY